MGRKRQESEGKIAARRKGHAAAQATYRARRDDNAVVEEGTGLPEDGSLTCRAACGEVTPSMQTPLQTSAQLTREEALQQAHAEGLTLRRVDTKSGYANVYVHRGRPYHPYQAKVRRSGKGVALGSFATAEEAALAVARSLEGHTAAERAVTAPLTTSSGQGKRKAPAKLSVKEEGTAVPPMPPDAVVKEESVKEERDQRSSDRMKDYLSLRSMYVVTGESEPYVAEVRRGGKTVHLGSFATAEEAEAALSVAWLLEGQAAAERVGTAPPTTTSEHELLLDRLRLSEPRWWFHSVKEEAQEENMVVPPMPSNARWSDTIVKQETKVVDNEQDHSDGQPKKKPKNR